MIFVQFYYRSPISGNLIEACGDRSVVALDGRNNIGTHHDIAAQEAIRRNYSAYQIRKGKLSEGGEALTIIVHMLQGEVQ